MNEKEKNAIEILNKWLCKTHSEFCKAGAVGIPNEEFFATEIVLKLVYKQNNKIQKIKQIVDIYNNTKGEFATLPNGEEICISDNEPIIAYLQEILEEEN